MKAKYFFLVQAVLFVSLNASANCYDQSRSPEDNYTHCKLAAEQGDSLAQYFVGQMYRTGDGVENSSEKALRWYRKAADQGNRPALYNLGWMYETGEGVPRNLDEAISWYEKAAQQGDQYAPFNIGALYYNGGDLPKNLEKALLWFDVATLNGNDKGRKWRVKITKHLSSEQLDDSTRRLEAWKAANPALIKK